jgi:hypothetical protein
MVPGAVDVVPLKVQLSVAPLFASVHVSVSVGPVTPKLAVATVGFVTERTADAEPPPKEPLIVAETVPPTAFVEAANVAVVVPAGTVTVAGTVTGSAADNVTAAPPTGAAPVKLTVPVTGLPPTTLAALNEIDASATLLVTVSIGDWRLAPLADAVMIAVPTDTAVTVNVALDAPVAIVTDAGTVATAALLVVSVTLIAAVVAPARLIVPCPLLPTAIVEVVSATAETAGDVLADVGELEPHRIVETAVSTINASATNGIVRRRSVLKERSAV